MILKVNPGGEGDCNRMKRVRERVSEGGRPQRRGAREGSGRVAEEERSERGREVGLQRKVWDGRNQMQEREGEVEEEERRERRRKVNLHVT